MDEERELQIAYIENKRLVKKAKTKVSFIPHQYTLFECCGALIN